MHEYLKASPVQSTPCKLLQKWKQKLHGFYKSSSSCPFVRMLALSFTVPGLSLSEVLQSKPVLPHEGGSKSAHLACSVKLLGEARAVANLSASLTFPEP